MGINYITCPCGCKFNPHIAFNGVCPLCYGVTALPPPKTIHEQDKFNNRWNKVVAKQEKSIHQAKSESGHFANNFREDSITELKKAKRRY